jgi:hypothetical protein
MTDRRRSKAWRLRRGRGLVHGLLLPAVLLGASVARADTIDACVSAVTMGQQLQREGKLRDARGSFLTCIRHECPPEVVGVCDRLLAAVEGSLPTVVLGARDSEGRDLVTVRVFVDGSLVMDALDGRAMPIDPGAHTLRFEEPSGMTVEQTVVIREAEKNRALTVTLKRPAVAMPDAPRPERPAPPPPVAAYVLAGVGGIALASFTYLAIHGQSQYDECRSHNCPSSTVDALSVDRALALGALGIGVVSLGAAAWLVLSRPNQSTPNVSFIVGSAAGGPVALARGSF